MVGSGRFELPTSSLSGTRSNQLSYEPTCRAPLWAQLGAPVRKFIGGRVERLRDAPKSGPCYPPGQVGRQALRQNAGRSKVNPLRKEVIQPQVPLQLPCYDLVPIIGLTVSASLLAVGRAPSGTPDFGGLTGGVYKAQVHIHRGVADPRLLAIPAS
jgi:hypothetical protein